MFIRFEGIKNRALNSDYVMDIKVDGKELVLMHCSFDEFVFQYDDQYVENHPGEFITFTMPVSKKPYSKAILTV